MEQKISFLNLSVKTVNFTKQLLFCYLHEMAQIWNLAKLDRSAIGDIVIFDIKASFKMTLYQPIPYCARQEQQQKLLFGSLNVARGQKYD